MKLFIVKLLSRILLPPGLFLVLIGGILLFLWEHRNRYRSRNYKMNYVYSGLIVLFLVIYILSSYVGEFILVSPLENSFPPRTYTEVKRKINDKSIIVVLGGGVVRGTPLGSEIGKTTLKRLYAGWQLQQKTGLDIVVSGGIVPGADATSGADIMENVLLDWGVNQEKIITESQSKNTWQNAVNTTELLEKLEYEEIILVTSAVHMNRAIYSFQENGNLSLIAVPTDYILDKELSLLDFLPNRISLRNSLSALHEWVGLVWYYLK
ncbi:MULTISPECIES: YdcF family protein [unclassified Candidatus Frackibacter]|uniref:YdcF family protein n=1 Tax=unclassified Candidatus Frackibacter TaxID=2648818 RepID=UPI00088CB53C|nr:MULTISPECIES: YdcF family protein [unclassified Candidatus Frackibacter]SDC50478.1 Uncharacterized SAM-binding protein YcdF, DUF218 family [Candidatus Frackibacter sp. WG11]SEM40365.1 Uncharacterized SAM-binding protein YcdF, DUF218 family [Candidatus Frackibacter sp. WG12]SFL74752.1 Uncharacterized SAM-binding protein YcdF, DUF218 family [Candidatus Frackibacter sp. WG13]